MMRQKIEQEIKDCDQLLDLLLKRVKTEIGHWTSEKHETEKDISLIKGRKEGLQMALDIYDAERGAELDCHLDGDGNCKHIETTPGFRHGPATCNFCGEEL